MTISYYVTTRHSSPDNKGSTKAALVKVGNTTMWMHSMEAG